MNKFQMAQSIRLVCWCFLSIDFSSFWQLHPYANVKSELPTEPWVWNNSNLIWKLFPSFNTAILCVCVYMKFKSFSYMKMIEINVFSLKTGWIMFSVFNSKQSVLCVIIKCFSLQNNVGISLLQFYNASTSFSLLSLEDYIQLVRVLKNVQLYNVCVFVYTYT